MLLLSPVQAFNLDRGQPCVDNWSLIPENTDVLMTHGPPFGYGDRTVSGFRCGCEDLLNIIQQREVPPRVHIFGHIHEDRGEDKEGQQALLSYTTASTLHWLPVVAYL
jgi:Icc-related predicted phosphoesterase